LADKISTAIIPWYDFSSISSRFSAKYQKKAENKAKTYRARINIIVKSSTYTYACELYTQYTLYTDLD
jgi:hypothetical protein